MDRTGTHFGHIFDSWLGLGRPALFLLPSHCSFYIPWVYTRTHLPPPPPPSLPGKLLLCALFAFSLPSIPHHYTHTHTPTCLPFVLAVPASPTHMPKPSSCIPVPPRHLFPSWLSILCWCTHFPPSPSTYRPSPPPLNPSIRDGTMRQMENSGKQSPTLLLVACTCHTPSTIPPFLPFSGSLHAFSTITTSPSGDRVGTG